jgi:RES domain-containing protein
VVYASESLALAALEYLVNVDAETAPGDLVAIAAVIPDSLAIRRVSAGELPKNWRGFPAPPELALLGTKWSDSLKTAVLQVPSVVVPQESNLVLNPRHPDFSKIIVRDRLPFAFDSRAWKRRPD